MFTKRKKNQQLFFVCQHKVRKKITKTNPFATTSKTAKSKTSTMEITVQRRKKLKRTLKVEKDQLVHEMTETMF